MREETQIFIMSGDGEAKTTPIKSLLRQLELARATELARGGFYREAERILTAFDEDVNSAPEILDLLARIHAQEGRLAEAEKLWARACQLEPSNTTYHDGMRRVATLQRRGGRRQTLLLPLILCFGTVVLLFTATHWLNRTDSTRQNVSIPTATPDVTPLPTETPIINPTPMVPSEIADLKTKISEVPGVKTGIEEPSNALGVTFDEGIFTYGTVLKLNAQLKLKEVGFQLKPYTDTIRVEIIGITDDLSMRLNSPYKDNAALGMERARVVYNYLHKNVGLDAQMFTIASDSEPQRPGSNEIPTDRSRNRTVILRINVRQK